MPKPQTGYPMGWCDAAMLRCQAVHHVVRACAGGITFLLCVCACVCRCAREAGLVRCYDVYWQGEYLGQPRNCVAYRLFETGRLS